MFHHIILPPEYEWWGFTNFGLRKLGGLRSRRLETHFLYYFKSCEYIVYTATINTIPIFNSMMLCYNVCVRFSPLVKNLGFRLDEHFSFKKQINHVKSISFIKLRSIARIKQFFKFKQFEMLIKAVVISGGLTSLFVPLSTKNSKKSRYLKILIIYLNLFSHYDNFSRPGFLVEYHVCCVV